MKAAKCIACKKANVDKNTIGLNKKLLGNHIINYYCIDCLADYLDVTTKELFERIEDFKEQGCELFE